MLRYGEVGKDKTPEEVMGMIDIVKKGDGFYIVVHGYDFNGRVPALERGPFSSEPRLVEEFRVVQDNSPYGEFIRTYRSFDCDGTPVITESVLYNAFAPYTADAHYSTFLTEEELDAARRKVVLETKQVQ